MQKEIFEDDPLRAAVLNLTVDETSVGYSGQVGYSSSGDSGRKNDEANEFDVLRDFVNEDL